jgi:hypothetical protein
LHHAESVPIVHDNRQAQFWVYFQNSCYPPSSLITAYKHLMPIPNYVSGNKWLPDGFIKYTNSEYQAEKGMVTLHQKMHISKYRYRTQYLPLSARLA